MLHGLIQDMDIASNVVLNLYTTEAPALKNSNISYYILSVCFSGFRNA